MKRRSGGKFTISVLYPVLYRLEEQGYIEVVRSEMVDGRGRSYYAATRAGREYLTGTLADYRMISGIFEIFMEGMAEHDPQCGGSGILLSGKQDAGRARDEDAETFGWPETGIAGAFS